MQSKRTNLREKKKRFLEWLKGRKSGRLIGTVNER
jgi:hypothetical protein